MMYLVLFDSLIRKESLDASHACLCASIRFLLYWKESRAISGGILIEFTLAKGHNSLREEMLNTINRARCVSRIKINLGFA